MPRNLDRRVEALVPVDEPELQRRLDEVLDVNLADDTLAWQLDHDGQWTRVHGTGSVDTHLRLQEIAADVHPPPHLRRPPWPRPRRPGPRLEEVASPGTALGVDRLLVAALAGDHDLARLGLLGDRDPHGQHARVVGRGDASVSRVSPRISCLLNTPRGRSAASSSRSPSRLGRSALTVSTLRSTSRSIGVGVDPGEVELDHELVPVAPGVHRHDRGTRGVPHSCSASRSRSRNGSVRISIVTTSSPEDPDAGVPASHHLSALADVDFLYHLWQSSCKTEIVGTGSREGAGQWWARWAVRRAPTPRVASTGSLWRPSWWGWARRTSGIRAAGPARACADRRRDPALQR